MTELKCHAPEVQQEGAFIEVQWKDGKSSQFHSIWLRHACLCPSCQDPSSQNRLRFPGDLEGHRIVSASRSGEKSALEVKWSDGHAADFPLGWLRRHCYSRWACQARSRARSPPLWSTSSGFALGTAGRFDYAAYMTDAATFWNALQALNRDGIVLLDDVPAQGPAGQPGVAAVAERIAYLRETSYGRVFDVVSVPNAENLAYTSLGLEMHADLQYYASPPGLQLLHCVRFDEGVRGGLSRFVDGFHALRAFRTLHPDHFRTLTSAKVTYQKNDAARSLYLRRRLVDVDDWDEPTAIHFSPQFEGPLEMPGGGEVLQRFYAAYVCLANFLRDEPSLEFRMRPGQATIFNNHRVLHARTAFQTSSPHHVRHLQGTYLDIEEFASSFKLACLSQTGSSDSVPLFHGSTP